jgi:hypothetical protein
MTVPSALIERRLAGGLLAWLVALATSGLACGDDVEGPAVEVALQIVRDSEALDTSDVTGFWVSVGDEQRAVAYDPTRTLALDFQAPPKPGTAVVVYACTLPNASCSEPFGVFVGCVVVDLAPADEPVVVTVALANRDPVPASCVGLVDPLPSS